MALSAMPRWVAACFVATLSVAPVPVLADNAAEAPGGMQPLAGSDLIPLLTGEVHSTATGGMDAAAAAPEGPVEKVEGPTAIEEGPAGTTVTTTRSVKVVGGELEATVEVDVVLANRENSSHGSATLRLPVCPDAEGRVRGHSVMSATATVRGVTRERNERTFRTDITGHVNDAARLVSIDRASNGSEKQAVTTQERATRTSARWSQSSEYRISGRKTEERDSSIQGQENTNKRRVSRDLNRFDGALLVLFDEAEKLWRSGYCVEINVTEGQSRAVKPKEKVEIEAEPRQRLEDKRVDAPISAKLTAGKKRVDPKRQPSAPAKFTYTGPDATGESGTVELRSVSRRGIGTTILTYDTGGDLRVDATITAAGGSPTHFTGTKCDGPAGAWTVHFQFTAEPGSFSGELTFTLDPQTLSGSMTGQSVGAGLRPALISGTASYDPATSMLSMTWPGSITIPVEKGSFC